MRSLVTIPLIFLAAALPGCADRSLPGPAPAKSTVEVGNGPTFVVTKLIGGPSDADREGCGGR